MNTNDQNIISSKQPNRFLGLFNRILKKEGFDPNEYLRLTGRSLKQMEDFFEENKEKFDLYPTIFPTPVPGMNNAVRFRWECIRRNPEYKKDYDEWRSKSDSNIIESVRDIIREEKKDPNSPVWEIVKRSTCDLIEIYEAFGRKWQCPPLDYRKTYDLEKGFDNFIDVIFQPDGLKGLICHMNDKEFTKCLLWQDSVVRLNWYSKDELAYPFKMDGEKRNIASIMEDVKKQLGLSLPEKAPSIKWSLKWLKSILLSFNISKALEQTFWIKHEKFLGMKTMNVTINLQCPQHQIRYVLDKYIQEAKKRLGVVSKFMFSEADPKGAAILKSLIQKGILISDKDFPLGVRLKQNIDESLSRPSEIQGSNFDEIWEMLRCAEIKERERKHFNKFFNCLKVYDLKREGIIERSVFEKELSNGASRFDWLKKNGYFEEDAGLEDYPKALTENLKNDLKKEYPFDSRKIINILQKYHAKRKSFLDIGKETHIYFDGFEQNEFKKPASAKKLLDELTEFGFRGLVGDDEIEKLNNLLKCNDLYERFPKEADDAGHKANLQGNDLMRSNRRILEMAFPKECPIKEEEYVNDSSLERQARRDFDDAKEYILERGYRNVR